MRQKGTCLASFMLGRLAINRKAYDAIEAKNQRLEPEVKVAHTTYLAEKAVREQTVQAAQVAVPAHSPHASPDSLKCTHVHTCSPFIKRRST
jgi:hypothetical protein